MQASSHRKAALKEAKLLHTSGITFGLAAHSRYNRNYIHEAFKESIANKPEECLVGLDFNYRGTLWSVEQARKVMTPIVTEHVDVLITTIEDMALLYGIGCGQYSVRQIVDGDMEHLEDDEIRAFAEKVHQKFKARIVAITIRYPDSFEQHRWESAAVHADGTFFRSPAVKSITLCDRLGGGRYLECRFLLWAATEDFAADSVIKGVLVATLPHA